MCCSSGGLSVFVEAGRNKRNLVLFTSCNPARECTMCWDLILTSARSPPSRVMGKPRYNSSWTGVWLLSTEMDGSCGGLLWGTLPFCLPEHLCQACHSNLHLPPEGKQISYIHCRRKLHSAQSFWKKP